MRNGKIRRFRPRSNKNHLRRVGHSSKNNGSHQINGHRNNFRNYVPKNPQSLERAIEKYNNLAKDALSSGDPILHESYLQHLSSPFNIFPDGNFNLCELINLPL